MKKLVEETNPLVSIIIPMFNAEKYIKETIDSILNQTYKNIEIIVVDDGSTDKSRDIILSYENKVKYYYQANSGFPSIARNVGIMYSTGELITFCDADDIMLEDKIEAQVIFLQNNEDINIVLMDYINIRNGHQFEKSHFQSCEILSKAVLEKSKKRPVILNPLDACSYLAEENFTSNSLLIRKNIIKSIGLFDERLIGGEDFEYTYRIVSKYPVGIINKVGFRRRLHEGNISQTSERMLKEFIKSREIILRYEKNYKIREKIRTFLAYGYMSLCDHNIGKMNGQAIRDLMQSVYYSFLLKEQAKKFIKILLSMFGVIKRVV